MEFIGDAKALAKCKAYALICVDRDGQIYYGAKAPQKFARQLLPKARRLVEFLQEQSAK